MNPARHQEPCACGHPPRRSHGGPVEQVSAALRKKALPDHLSVELDCLAGLEETGRHSLATDFARRHVLRWLPALKAHVDRHARLAFYRVCTRALLDMLTGQYT